MENDDATVGRLYTRREALVIARQAGLTIGASGALFGLFSPRTNATDGQPQPVHVIASPSLTEGPFYVNEKLKRSDLVTGNTRHTIVEAVPLRLGLTVFSSADKSRFSALAATRARFTLAGPRRADQLGSGDARAFEHGDDGPVHSCPAEREQQ